MLSIPPGWYLLRRRDLVVRYWDGRTFTEHISPRGHGKYSSLTWRALRKWKKYDNEQSRLHSRNFMQTVVRSSFSLPDGYIEAY